MIWDAFQNRYWPAQYFIDAQGIIRDHHFGEGRYDRSERAIQAMLGIEHPLVSADGVGVEAAADWDHLRKPETYLGDERSERSASTSGAAFDEPRTYELPEICPWTAGASPGSGPWVRRTSSLIRAAEPSPSDSTRRTPHLVLSPGGRRPIPFRVLLDGKAPGSAHGVDVDDEGDGILREGRLYQLVRQPDTVDELKRSKSPSSSPVLRRTRSPSGSEHARPLARLRRALRQPPK